MLRMRGDATTMAQLWIDFSSNVLNARMPGFFFSGGLFFLAGAKRESDFDGWQKRVLCRFEGFDLCILSEMRLCAPGYIVAV